MEWSGGRDRYGERQGSDIQEALLRQVDSCVPLGLTGGRLGGPRSKREDCYQINRIICLSLCLLYISACACTHDLWRHVAGCSANTQNSKNQTKVSLIPFELLLSNVFFAECNPTYRSV